MTLSQTYTQNCTCSEVEGMHRPQDENTNSNWSTVCIGRHTKMSRMQIKHTCNGKRINTSAKYNIDRIDQRHNYETICLSQKGRYVHTRNLGQMKRQNFEHKYRPYWPPWSNARAQLANQGVPNVHCENLHKTRKTPNKHPD